MFCYGSPGKLTHLLLGRLRLNPTQTIRNCYFSLAFRKQPMRYFFGTIQMSSSPSNIHVMVLISIGILCFNQYFQEDCKMRFLILSLHPYLLANILFKKRDFSVCLVTPKHKSYWKSRINFYPYPYN